MRVLRANKVTEDSESDKVKIFLMRDYIHGWCNMDTKHVGIGEYAKGTALTCAQFRQLFMEMSSS
jgi:hypothetical protein